MSLRNILSGAVVGLALQAIVGWAHPLTVVFTAFVAGLITRSERDGTLSGLIIGIVAGIGISTWAYIGFSVPFSNPAAQIIGALGSVGVYATAAAIVLFGFVGGRIGGSMMQKTIEESFRKGETAGTIRKQLKDSVKKMKKGLFP